MSSTGTDRDDAHMEKRLKVTVLDAIVLCALAAFSLWVFHRIRVDLHYNWHWEAIPQYLFRFDEQRHAWVPNFLIKGFLTTIKLSIWSTLLATLLGVIMALFRVSKSLLRRMIGRTYVELIRNMPPLVLVFIVYYFISDQILNAMGINNLLGSLGRARRISWQAAAPRRLSCRFSSQPWSCSHSMRGLISPRLCVRASSPSRRASGRRPVRWGLPSGSRCATLSSPRRP